MKNIILAVVIIMFSFPSFAGECSYGSCGFSVSAKRAPVRGLFRRFRLRKSYRCHVSKLESCDMKKVCCEKGCCSPEMAKKPVVCTRSACPAGCSVDECCDKCCGKKCCASKKCKCTHCK